MNFHTRLCCGILLTMSLLLTGCMGRFERPPVPKLVAPSPHPGSYTLNQYISDLKAYDAAVSAGDASAADAKKIRNKIVYGVMAEVDYVFYDYETKLFLNQGTFNVGSDALQLGLSAAGTISNGARSKTILSALLSGVTGTSLSVDKNFFRQQTVQAISSSMEATRDRIKTTIIRQLDQDVTTYPFQAARADLIRYFFAGTLPAGLQQLHQQAATNAQDEKETLIKTQVRDITEDDVKCATAVNQAAAQAVASGDFTKLIVFLKAMGQSVDETSDQKKRESVETGLRDLGSKILTDATLRKKYCDEAKKAQLI